MPRRCRPTFGHASVSSNRAWGDKFDYTVGQLRSKAAFYRPHAEQAQNEVEKEYWARIAEHWLELARIEEDPGDEAN
jgi:hypothetical protein